MACLIVPESGLWAHRRHGPSLRVEEVREDLFSVCWTFLLQLSVNTSSELVQKLLCEGKLAELCVIQSSPLDEMRSTVPHTAVLGISQHSNDAKKMGFLWPW